MTNTSHDKKRARQKSFYETEGQYRECHGGNLRQKRRGRRQRPLSTKRAHHIVFKINRERIKYGGLRTGSNFVKVHDIVRRYAFRFFVNVEQMSVQGDHIHMLLRTSRRSQFHSFFRVVAGQIAQQFHDEGRLARVTGTPKTPRKNGTGLWKHRPFSRIVAASRQAYKTVRDYIQLNEKEARGEIPYRKERLRGLSADERERLWA